VFENLLESNKKPAKTFGQTVVSAAVHVVLIAGAVQATKGVAQAAREIVVDTNVVFLKPPEATPPPPPPEQVVVSANPPPQGFQVITPPAEIPTEIPPVDLNQRFDARDFTGKGVEGGISTGVVGGTGPVPTVEGEVFLSAEVDEIPAVAPGAACAGKYPPVLEQAGVPGKVVLEFVVNTDGRVDAGNVKVITSTNKAFEEPARAGILGGSCSFKPGKTRGQPVRVLVRLPISFAPPN
jgi:periplasmic protein TonB